VAPFQHDVSHYGRKPTAVPNPHRIVAFDVFCPKGLHGLLRFEDQPTGRIVKASLNQNTPVTCRNQKGLAKAGIAFQPHGYAASTISAELDNCFCRFVAIGWLIQLALHSITKILFFPPPAALAPRRQPIELPVRPETAVR
jgi:hypothetical protein